MGKTVGKALGLYIHVPFCISKCPYCDFYSLNPDNGVAEAYTDAVCHAVKSMALSGLGSRNVDTVYFGGGTPVLLGAKNLSDILETISVSFRLQNPEITVEANPGAISFDGLKSLYAQGFNRISFGVQSGIDAELKALGRIHTAAQARESVINSANAGFINISADIMLGIPRQTAESLNKTVDFIEELPLTHISAYMLKIEKGTDFYKHGVSCPNEDELADMYLNTVDRLESMGFLQYEISNFAKNGEVSRHNMKYWTLGEYLGIGPSAHSFIDGRRFFIPRDLKAFINTENPESLFIGDGEGGGFEEYAMLRLRLTNGLDLTETAEIFGADTDKITSKAKPLSQKGLCKIENNVISLTPKGFLLSNAVTASLIF